MDRRIWSKFPQELLAAIISLTGDSETLDHWCKATVSNPYLYQVALRQKWKEVTIEDQDLVPCPGVDCKEWRRKQRKLRKAIPSWKPRAGKVLELTQRLENGTVPASFTQSLSLDFRMQSFWVDLPDIEFPEFLMPSAESLEYTLSLLSPYLINVRQIRADGLVPQSVLNTIVNVPSAQYRSLKIRAFNGLGAIYYNDLSREGLSTQRILCLDALDQLKTLRDLEIHHLSNEEAPRLVKAIPHLKQLERLVVADDETAHESSTCPMEVFLHSLLADNGVGDDQRRLGLDRGCILPLTLASLKLVDTGAMSSNVPRLQSLLRDMAPMKLRWLYIDIKESDAILSLVEYFGKQSISTLSVPGASRSRTGINWPQVDPSRVDCLNHLIRSQRSTLQRLEILRVWGTDREFVETLNDTWSGAYSIQELVLGSRSPIFYLYVRNHWKSQFPIPNLKHYLYGYDNIENNGRWGTRLQRLRIDHIDIDDLNVDGLSDPCHINLKILMLQPCKMRHNPDKLSTSTESDESSRMKLASAIAAQALPALRVVVIGPRWFWLERRDSVDGLASRVWEWPHAQEDAVQSIEMSKHLSILDRTFLTNVTIPWYAERHHFEWKNSHWRASRPEWPNEEMMNTWNVMTLLPDQAKDDTILASVF